MRLTRAQEAKIEEDTLSDADTIRLVVASLHSLPFEKACSAALAVLIEHPGFDARVFETHGNVVGRAGHHAARGEKI